MAPVVLLKNGRSESDESAAGQLPSYVAVYMSLRKRVILNDSLAVRNAVMLGYSRPDKAGYGCGLERGRESDIGKREVQQVYQRELLKPWRE